MGNFITPEKTLTDKDIEYYQYNYNKLKEIFKEEKRDFNEYINKKILDLYIGYFASSSDHTYIYEEESNIFLKFLVMLQKNCFSFKNYKYDYLLNSLNKYNLELTIFLVKNIIDKNYPKSKNICRDLLNSFNEIDFDKFKVFFQHGYPLIKDCVVCCKDVIMAEKIFQYFNEFLKDANLIYSINYTTPDELRKSILWYKSRNIHCDFLNKSWYYRRDINISYLNILKEFDFIKPKPISLEIFPEDVKQWLLNEGFTEKAEFLYFDNNV